MDAYELFSRLFHLGEKVDFKSKWANNTGYFDNIVKENLKSPTSFIDDRGREVVAIPSGDMVIVMMQRYGKSQIPAGEKIPIVVTHYRKDVKV